MTPDVHLLLGEILSSDHASDLVEMVRVTPEMLDVTVLIEMVRETRIMPMISLKL